jgi:hypothetical protein
MRARMGRMVAALSRRQRNGGTPLPPWDVAGSQAPALILRRFAPQDDSLLALPLTTNHGPMALTGGLEPRITNHGFSGGRTGRRPRSPRIGAAHDELQAME